MEVGVYEEILHALKSLPQEKVLEAKHFIDFLAEQSKTVSPGYGTRFSDLYYSSDDEDEAAGALLETVDEGYVRSAARAARS